MFLCAAGQVSIRELELRQTSFPGLELCLVIGWSLGSTLDSRVSTTYFSASRSVFSDVRLILAGFRVGLV